MAPLSSGNSSQPPRQSTLSSFFAPKPSGAASSSSVQPMQRPKKQGREEAMKQKGTSDTPIYLDDEEEGGEEEAPPSKRQKLEAQQVDDHDDDELPDAMDFGTVSKAAATNGKANGKEQSDFVKSFYASGTSGSLAQDRGEGPSKTPNPAPSTSAFFKQPSSRPTSTTPKPPTKPTSGVSAAQRLAAFAHRAASSSQPADSASAPTPGSAEDEAAKKKRHEAFRNKLLVRNSGRGPVVYAQKEGVWAPGAEVAMLKGAQPSYGPPAVDGQGGEDGLDGEEGGANGAGGEDDEIDDEGDSSPAPAKGKGKGKKDEKGAKGAKSKAAAHLAKFASTTSKGKGKSKAKVDTGPKYTPLEQQWLAIKEKNPDVVLLMEVGYKYKFFGQDAQLASLHLSIAHFPSHNFPTAMVPAHRVHLHVRRLVMAGLKVGVVRQIETRALKKGGAMGEKSGPFRRELKEVWTRSTWVDGMDVTTALTSGAAGGGEGDGVQQAWIVALRATPGGGTGTSEKVRLALVGVCPQNGQVVWDEWEDGHLRAGLETRWLHLSGTGTRGPGEVVRVGEWDGTTTRVVEWLAGIGGEGSGETRAARIEMGNGKVDQKADLTFVTDFCRPRRAKKGKGKKQQEGEDSGEENIDLTKEGNVGRDDEAEAEHEAESEWLKAVVDLPPKVISALAALIRYMDTFSLASIFRRPSRFSHLSSRRHMLLPGTTVTNLELYANATDGRVRGSLLWVLDRTKTIMGRRLLRDWIGRPLVDPVELRRRQATVAELAESSSWQAGKLKNLVMGLPDLEKGLVRIHYGKCTPPELIRILNALHRVSCEFSRFAAPEDVGFESDELNGIVYSLPLIRETVEKYLAVLNPAAAKEDKKEDMFRDEEENVPDIVDCKDCVAAVDVEINVHLRDVRKQLSRPSLNFITVAQEELLLEIPIAQSKKIPADWVKINGTKSVYRYRTPQAQELLEQRDQSRERLAAEADRAFSTFLEAMTEDYEALRDAVRKLAIADCLLSLASVAQHPGYCRPEFVDRPHVDLKRARHPVVEQVTEDPYVDNDVLMEEIGLTTPLLFGTNMGGKSSASRMIACIVIMAQIGSFVPAASAKLGIFDSCYTRMGASDELSRGRSTFMVEMSEASDILKMATPRSLVILDELGRGTSTHDGVAIASAVLHHLVAQIGCFTIFVTHYPQINQIAKAHPNNVKSFHMAFLETHRADGLPDITFLYKIAPGAATRSHGLNVARIAGLPDSVLATAKRQAEHLEEDMQARKREESARKAARVLRALKQGTPQSGDFVELAQGMSYASQ